MAGKNFKTAKTDRIYNQIADATADPEDYYVSETHDTQETDEEQFAQETPDNQEIKKVYKPRREYDEEETQQILEAGKTQGRKGCKMLRINMAFEPDIHEFIRTMARVRGETVTDFTNHVFRRYMEENADIYQQAMKFRDSL